MRLPGVVSAGGAALGSGDGDALKHTDAGGEDG